MTPTASPYLCAVCRAPVLAGARFCAQCGTPFSERPPLRVAAPGVAPSLPPSAPGAAVPPPGRVPVAPPPVAYGAAPPSYATPPYASPAGDEAPRRSAALWIGGFVVLFVAALVGAYLLFAEPVDRAERAEETFGVPAAPSPSLPPPVAADDGLDDGSFPTEDELQTIDEIEAAMEESIQEDPTPPEDVPETVEPLPEEAAPPPEPEAPPVQSPEMGAAWGRYQDAAAAYAQAVRVSGTDKARAEIAAACRRLVEAGDAVLRLPGRERYASRIARERRLC